MGAGTGADIVSAPPDGEVVAALLAGFGVVGDLIGQQTGGRQGFLGDFVKFEGDLIVRDRDPFIENPGSRLDG